MLRREAIRRRAGPAATSPTRTAVPIISNTRAALAIMCSAISWVLNTSWWVFGAVVCVMACSLVIES